MAKKVSKSFQSLLLPVLSIIIALVLGAIIMAALGYDVGKAYSSLLKGAFGSKNAIGETLLYTTPLLFCALGYAFAFRCGLINLGGEGQYHIGAIVGSIVGSRITGLTSILHIPLVIMCGFLGGALWGFIVGLLKMKFAASELITTIMLNYIAIKFADFCVTSPPFRDATAGAAPRMPTVQDSVKLGIILPGTRLHAGIIVALLGVLFFYIFMFRTTRGYEMRVIGLNKEAGRYSGMNIPTNSVLAMSLAGGFAGIGGAIQIMGVLYFFPQNFGSNFGFSGVAVALLGNCHPVGMIASAILFGGLNAGGSRMQSVAKVPNASIEIIQGLIIIFAVSYGLFQWFRNGGKHVIAKFFGRKNTAKEEG